MLKSLSEYGFGRNFSYSMVDYDACNNEKSTESVVGYSYDPNFNLSAIFLNDSLNLGSICFLSSKFVILV